MSGCFMKRWVVGRGTFKKVGWGKETLRRDDMPIIFIVE